MWLTFLLSFFPQLAQFYFSRYTFEVTSNFWDSFKKGKIQVRVTSKNIKSFLQIAKNKGIEWCSKGKFNPFDSYDFSKVYSKVYLEYKPKGESIDNGLKYSNYRGKDKVIVDWNEILSLLPNRTVYSNDFDWLDDRKLENEENFRKKNEFFRRI